MVQATENCGLDFEVHEELLAKIRRVCLNPCPQDLTVEEIKEAAVQIIIYIQTQTLDKRHLVNLRPVQASNNVLCIGCRIASAPISKEARNSIILPARHFVVDLIIQHYHVIAGHSGREHVLGLIRERYWIIRARRSVDRVLRSCRHCRRCFSRPVS